LAAVVDPGIFGTDPAGRMLWELSV